MKTPSRPTRRPAPSEDDIRACAVLIYEQSGCVPNRDIENWLEARARLEAGGVLPREFRRGLQARRRGRPRTGTRPCGFTMPASDTALWIDQASCD